MSRTIKKTKETGDDFWSRRCFGVTSLGVGYIAKWITKHKERQRNKRMAYKAMHDHEDFEKRFPGE